MILVSYIVLEVATATINAEFGSSQLPLPVVAMAGAEKPVWLVRFWPEHFFGKLIIFMKGMSYATD